MRSISSANLQSGWLQRTLKGDVDRSDALRGLVFRKIICVLFFLIRNLFFVNIIYYFKSLLGIIKYTIITLRLCQCLYVPHFTKIDTAFSKMYAFVQIMYYSLKVITEKTLSSSLNTRMTLSNYVPYNNPERCSENFLKSVSNTCHIMALPFGHSYSWIKSVQHVCPPLLNLI